MEKYLNVENIVKDEVFKVVENEVICPICFELMIVPMICIECQNLICQKCIEKWKQKGGTCPNGCKVFDFRKVIEKNRKISSIKFKCIKGCGAEIPFNEIENHYKSECIKKKKTMTLLSNDEVLKLREKGKKGKKNIAYFTRKYI
jgi:hypothetical protein